MILRLHEIDAAVNLQHFFKYNGAIMTPKECLLTALRRGIPDRIPTFEWFIDETVCQALCGSNDPIEAVERLDLDAVNVRADYDKT